MIALRSQLMFAPGCPPPLTPPPCVGEGPGVRASVRLPTARRRGWGVGSTLQPADARVSTTQTGQAAPDPGECRRRLVRERRHHRPPDGWVDSQIGQVLLALVEVDG